MQKIVNKIEITEEDYRPSAKAESCHNSTGFERRNHKKNPYHQLRSGIVSNADDSADQRKAVDHKSNSGYEEKCGAKNPNKKKKKKVHSGWILPLCLPARSCRGVQMDIAPSPS